MTAGDKKVADFERVYMQIGDQHEQILALLDLPLLDPSASLDKNMIFRMALVTAFQFAETLPDFMAAQATMARRDWKYALQLPVNHPGISATALCKFRESLYFSATALHEFEELHSYLEKIGLYANVTEPAVGLNEALACVCRISRFYHLNLAMKTALSLLVATHTDWLRANALPHWYNRYRTERLNQVVKLSEDELQKEAVRIGKDIQHLLTGLNEPSQPQVTRREEIQHLEQLIKSEFTMTGNRLSWRLPNCAACICSNLGLIRLNSPPRLGF
jgi:hypothetical protein